MSTKNGQTQATTTSKNDNPMTGRTPMTMTWTPEKHAEAVSLCEAATEGPWEPQEFDTYPGDEGVAVVGSTQGVGLVAYALKAGAKGHHWYDVPQCEADGVFIARARTLLPEALAEIDRLRAELAEACRASGSQLPEGMGVGRVWAVAPVQSSPAEDVVIHPRFPDDETPGAGPARGFGAALGGGGGVMPGYEHRPQPARAQEIREQLVKANRQTTAMYRKWRMERERADRLVGELAVERTLSEARRVRIGRLEEALAVEIGARDEARVAVGEYRETFRRLVDAARLPAGGV